MVSIQSVWLLIYMQRSRFMSHFREKILPKSQKMLICCFCMKICSCYNLYAVPSLPFRFLVNYCMLASWSVFTFPSQTLSIMLYEIIDIRGGSRGGSLGSNEPPFLLIHSTYWFFVTRPAVFDTQHWRASPVWLLYNLRAIQFNVHAVK